MLHEPTENLDALIKEEKRRVALEFFQDAWNAAVQEGIEPSILAETAVFTALTELSEAEGDDSVASLLAALPDRHQSGHFVLNRSLQ